MSAGKAAASARCGRRDAGGLGHGLSSRRAGRVRILACGLRRERCGSSRYRSAPYSARSPKTRGIDGGLHQSVTVAYAGRDLRPYRRIRLSAMVCAGKAGAGHGERVAVGTDSGDRVHGDGIDVGGEDRRPQPTITLTHCTWYRAVPIAHARTPLGTGAAMSRRTRSADPRPSSPPRSNGAIGPTRARLKYPGNHSRDEADGGEVRDERVGVRGALEPSHDRRCSQRDLVSVAARVPEPEGRAPPIHGSGSMKSTARSPFVSPSLTFVAVIHGDEA